MSAPKGTMENASLEDGRATHLLSKPTVRLTSGIFARSAEQPVFRFDTQILMADTEKGK